MLSNSSESRHTCLVPNFGRKAYSQSPLYIMLTIQGVGVVDVLYQVEEVPFHFYFFLTVLP